MELTEFTIRFYSEEHKEQENLMDLGDREEI